MLWYCPLESYPERYTCQLSAAKTGWLESNWIAEGIDYVRVGGPDEEDGHIHIGQVLDAGRRTGHCFTQCLKLLAAANAGNLTSKDVIFLDDFWHPGFASLPYSFHMMGIKPKIYATCYAQSVDVFDFTWPMRDWMRHFEKGIGEVLDGIFVACPMLKDLIVQAGIAPAKKVHDVGLVFDSNEVRERMTLMPKRNKVVWSSRWDAEKNPMEFLRLVKKVNEIQSEDDEDVEFVICTSQPKLRSNSDLLMAALNACVSDFSNLTVKEGLTKEEYYRELSEAKIQFNSAKQDWVAFTLLEASVAGCYPLYPNFRAFPETFRFDDAYLYHVGGDVLTAEKVLRILDDNSLHTREAQLERAWIHDRFDVTWLRQAIIMGLVDEDLPPSPFLSVIEAMDVKKGLRP